MKKAGIIGIGRRGFISFAGCLSQMDDVKLIAICDINNLISHRFYNYAV